MEVVEATARQAVALAQSHSVDITTVESTTGPFLGQYHAAVDLVASDASGECGNRQSLCVVYDQPVGNPKRKV
jgi:hypothetical protein